jgi:hypothetical protein
MGRCAAPQHMTAEDAARILLREELRRLASVYASWVETLHAAHEDGVSRVAVSMSSCGPIAGSWDTALGTRQTARPNAASTRDSFRRLRASCWAVRLPCNAFRAFTSLICCGFLIWI